MSSSCRHLVIIEVRPCLDTLEAIDTSNTITHWEHSAHFLDIRLVLCVCNAWVQCIWSVQGIIRSRADAGVCLRESWSVFSFSSLTASKVWDVWVSVHYWCFWTPCIVVLQGSSRGASCGLEVGDALAEDLGELCRAHLRCWPPSKHKGTSRSKQTETTSSKKMTEPKQQRKSNKPFQLPKTALTRWGSWNPNSFLDVCL